MSPKVFSFINYPITVRRREVSCLSRKWHTSFNLCRFSHQQPRTFIQPSHPFKNPRIFSVLGKVERRRRRRHFDDGWPVQDHGVIQGHAGWSAREEDICLTHGSGWDHGCDQAAVRCWCNRRGTQTTDEDDGEGRRKRALDAEGEGHTLGSRNALGRGQSGECHDRKCGIVAWAGLDEGCGGGVDRVKTESGAVWICRCDFSEVESMDCSVDRFGDEDRTSNAEICLAGDETCSAKVGGYADALEHRGESDEGMGVSIREVVCAGCHWLGASGHDGRSEKLDMLLFVVSNVLEVGVVLGAEAGCHEVLLRHAFNAAFVESVFEMLQGEGILEDIDVGRGSLAFVRAGKSCDEQKGCHCGGSEELHTLIW